MGKLYPSDWYVWTIIISGIIGLVLYLKAAWDIHKHKSRKR
jgi:uncharacterized membrane protein